MIILIPSYEPDQRLIDIVRSLRTAGHQLVVVDDGSGPAYWPFFDAVERLGAKVLVHQANRGKGAALKTGFAFIAEAYPGQAVVCADSDGQHSVCDIERVARHLAGSDADLVLGARRFTGKVPARSKFGNSVTRRVFALATGRDLIDTQTGLRAHAARTLEWLGAIEGDRFEYELRVLLAATREKRSIEEVEIETIYLEENASSHFRPLWDSLAIYRQLLAFLTSSFIGFGIDVIALFALTAWTGSLVGSVIGARLISATANYSLNRWWVFRGADRSGRGTSLLRYAALAVTLLAANVLLMQGIVVLTGSLALAKIVTEVSLVALSYLIQRTFVFARRNAAVPSPTPAETPAEGPANDRSWAPADPASNAPLVHSR